MLLAEEKPFPPARVRTGLGHRTARSPPVQPKLRAGAGAGDRARSPLTFSARIRPPRSRRLPAMAQTPRAEVAPRYVTCARTHTQQPLPRGSAPRSRWPIASQGACARILGGHSLGPRPWRSSPILDESSRAPPLGGFCWKSRPSLQAYSPCPDLTPNSAASHLRARLLELCLLRFWFDLKIFCV